MSRVARAPADDVLASDLIGPAAHVAVEAHFDALVRAHYADLCRLAYRYVRSRATAEDIVQDVFAGIWNRATPFDFVDPLPYLCRAVRNRALSHLRHVRIHDRWQAAAAVDESVNTTRYSGSDASDEADMSELAAAIARAVNALPLRCRQVFTMQREGMTYAEVARALGASEKTVENQMGRALKALRTRLAPFLVAIAFALLAAG